MSNLMIPSFEIISNDPKLAIKQYEKRVKQIKILIKQYGNNENLIMILINYLQSIRHLKNRMKQNEVLKK